ncbi:3-alpha--hydroxysteroid dehydrogenase [Hyaloraphidium curvatum]|nr:3-alpha--hydroxysteroid dehydrogenase [Hyaloraphidium curvatum]
MSAPELPEPTTRLVNKSTGKGRTAFITGSAQGFGRETALLFAVHGASAVAISDIPSKEAAGRKVCEEVVAAGGGKCKAEWFPLDVTNESEWEAQMARFEELYGPLDIMVANAGIFFHEGPLEDISLSEFRRVQAVNVDGVFLASKYAIRSFKKRLGDGPDKPKEAASIVNLSSIAGLIGSANHPAYGASKGAVRIFTKATAMYLARAGYNARCNSVHPGLMVTQMWTDVFPQEAAAQNTPIGRGGTARDVANLIVYLSSSESDFSTGAEFVVDGGVTAV